MQKIIVLVVCSLMMFSCALNKETRRLNRASKKLERLVDKYPELLRTDTIFDTLKVSVPEVRIDTVVANSDTIRLVKDNWHVRIIYRGDSTLISGGCDTVFLEIPVKIPYDKIQPVIREKENIFESMKRGLIALIVIAFVVILLVAILKK